MKTTDDYHADKIRADQEFDKALKLDDHIANLKNNKNSDVITRIKLLKEHEASSQALKRWVDEESHRLLLRLIEKRESL